jgi:hypothetical protein
MSMSPRSEALDLHVENPPVAEAIDVPHGAVEEQLAAAVVDDLADRHGDPPIRLAPISHLPGPQARFSTGLSMAWPVRLAASRALRRVRR